MRATIGHVLILIVTYCSFIAQSTAAPLTLAEPPLTPPTITSGGANRLTMRGSGFTKTMAVKIGDTDAKVLFYDTTRVDLQLPPLGAELAGRKLPLTVPVELQTVTAADALEVVLPLELKLHGIEENSVIMGNKDLALKPEVIGGVGTKKMTMYVTSPGDLKRVIEVDEQGKQTLLRVEWPSITFPEPTLAEVQVAAAVTSVENGSLMRLKLPAVAAAIWLDGGRYLVLADTQGILHKLRTEDWTTVATLKLPHRPVDLDLSAEGLIVSFDDLAGLAVVDPLTLRGIRTVQCLPGMQVATHPLQAFAFAVKPGGKSMYVLDLATGTILREWKAEFLSNAIGDKAGVTPLIEKFDALAMGVEGKRLYVANSRLYAFQVTMSTLAWEAMITEPLNNPTHIVVSPDDKWVCAAGSANYTNEAGSGFFIYPSNKLTEKALTVELPGSKPGTMAFAEDGSVIHASDAQHLLVTYDLQGQILRKIPSGTSAATSMVRIMPHPANTGVLLLQRHGLDWLAFESAAE